MLVLSVYSVEIECKLCREIVHAYILSTNPLAWWYVMKDRMENIKSVQQQLLYSILWTRSHCCRADGQQQQQLMVPWSYQEADLKEWVSGIANKLTRITWLSCNRLPMKGWVVHQWLMVHSGWKNPHKNTLKLTHSFSLEQEWPCW